MEINIRSRQTSIWLEKWFVLITGHLSVQQDTGGKQGAVLWAHNKWCGCLIEMGNKTLNASWHADLQPERTQTPISIMEWTTNKQSQDIRRGCVYICVSVCVKSRLMNNVWIISFCTNERISVQQKKQTTNPRNISRAQVRSDTVSLERASAYRQICFAGFCVRMNQQHFLFF